MNITALSSVVHPGRSTAEEAKPLKIFMLAEAFQGGIATHLGDLCEGLAKRGHEIDLVYSPCRMDWTARQELERLEVIGRNVNCTAMTLRRSLTPADVRNCFRFRRYACNGSRCFPSTFSR